MGSSTPTAGDGDVNDDADQAVNKTTTGTSRGIYRTARSYSSLPCIDREWGAVAT